MPRIVSVWLERFAVARLRVGGAGRGEPVVPGRPLVLAEAAPGGPRLYDLDEAASRAGLAPGGRLTDARALVGPDLQVRPADPAGDAEALRALALWATRYAPHAAPWGGPERGYGLHLDVEGAAHLLGGEAALVDDLVFRLERFGLRPHLALAPTVGLAYGLARFGGGGRPIVPPGGEAAALAPLPVEALRLDAATCGTLRRLGLRRVGDLLGRPRAPLARRFGEGLLRRLDQALGRWPEPLDPVEAPAAYAARHHFQGEVLAQEAVALAAADLMRRLVPALERDGVGARHLRLSLARAGGGQVGDRVALDLRLAAPTRDPAHVGRLVALELERRGGDLEAGLGFETARLAVTWAERCEPVQDGLGPEHAPAGGGRTALDDRLRQRLGPGRLLGLEVGGTHVPERASAPHPLGAGEARPSARPSTRPLAKFPGEDGPAPGRRPLLLLARAEPAEVEAAGPFGEPARFRWRGLHEVIHAEGPERIAGEWWRASGEATRDYYVAESREGRRFWLYREAEHPRWFVHGLFA